MQQQLLFQPVDFNPNNYCLKYGAIQNCHDCTGCVHSKSVLNECCPCNSCPKREGYWTPSKTEEGKNIEVKCHAPCRIFNHWKARLETKYGKDIECLKSGAIKMNKPIDPLEINSYESKQNSAETKPANAGTLDGC